MQEMTATTWKRTGSSIVWHPVLLAELVREVEPTPLRIMVGWLKNGFPDNPPSGEKARTVLVGGLQGAVETMMLKQTPDEVEGWLRQNVLATVRAWKSHWPNVGLVLVMDGPGALLECNVDDLVYFGRGHDRSKKVKLSSAIWNGAASGSGAYQLVVPDTKDVGGYFVRWLS